MAIYVITELDAIDGTSGKEPACQCKRQKRFRFDPWVRRIPQRREWQPTPVFLPGESHGQRNLVGYGVAKNWTRLTHTHTHTHTHTLPYRGKGRPICHPFSPADTSRK